MIYIYNFLKVILIIENSFIYSPKLVVVNIYPLSDPILHIPFVCGQNACAVNALMYLCTDDTDKKKENRVQCTVLEAHCSLQTLHRAPCSRVGAGRGLLSDWSALCADLAVNREVMLCSGSADALCCWPLIYWHPNSLETSSPPYPLRKCRLIY